MGSHMRKLFLRGLGYPAADTFAVEDTSKYRQLVVWLEDTKIRFYKPEERKELRATGAHAQWEAAFAKFLEEMGCDIEPSPENRGKVVDFLMFQAVGFDYKDGAEKLNTMAASLKPPREQPVASSSQPKNNKRSRAQAQSQNAQPPLSKIDTPEFIAALTKVAELLKVPVQTDDPAKLLKTTLAVAQRVLSPAAIEATAAAAQHASQEKGDKTLFGLSKSQFPLGFDMGDSNLETLATVLRVLHVNELRTLQSQVDHMIVEMQEHTADPKTDAKLGKVGV
uniref:Uncharacterized protein n=1 Tax=Pyramimonas obovata TaxID=1411642 RepID=A0A7S0QZ09_9CHLO|mmetsp:Transcript_18788/g.41111  ORF Transcript_18788/g.41111 Transcript_18788/m.41111 type:complete len:280 (+) Transcript_18788:129-968(+)|eukprot:CAMPEP_0118931722 /NCGR_PEP_ID=MMETSP1169-20130426/7965_1 /TAXON_ID=36882 /ORGANISM="Pyramimonas obovata, Strain CCMP722" /LENGTH=279 /DNA_ID=CAMNT_0006874255 /DNA_START=105 /DNA_END=944 /DNA_ORIENTATION=+